MTAACIASRRWRHMVRLYVPSFQLRVRPEGVRWRAALRRS